MKGYWGHHKYERRAVSRDLRGTGFVGWIELLQLANKFKGWLAERNKAMFAVFFLTGGRAMEVLPLQSENFTIEKDSVIVKNMPLLKRYDKIGRWTEYADEKPENRLARLFEWNQKEEKWSRNRYDTEHKKEFRNFSFPTNEPLAKTLVSWIEEHEGCLFKGYSKKHLSYVRSYQIFTGIGIYPHWLRAQRASCLISFYDWKMEEMMEWMGWEELTTARFYAKFGVKRLGAKMIGKTYPKKALELE